MLLKLCTNFSLSAGINGPNALFSQHPSGDILTTQ